MVVLTPVPDALRKRVLLPHTILVHSSQGSSSQSLRFLVVRVVPHLLQRCSRHLGELRDTFIDYPDRLADYCGSCRNIENGGYVDCGNEDNYNSMNKTTNVKNEDKFWWGEQKPTLNLSWIAITLKSFVCFVINNPKPATCGQHKLHSNVRKKQTDILTLFSSKMEKSSRYSPFWYRTIARAATKYSLLSGR